MNFADLRLAEPILRSVATEGYTVATPIQAQAIPHVLAGRDVLGCAQTGTGKTAAFALPMLHRLAAAPQHAARGQVRSVILCPTRELATQTAESFRVYGRHLGLKCAVIYGGVGQSPQVNALRQGLDVLVATPGRLLDLMNQGHVDLRAVEVLVLDEADRMLDMGFINDIRKIVGKIPAQRQTLFFSATMPREIRNLADALLRDPANVQIAAVTATAENVEEAVYFVGRNDKPALLAHLYEHLPMARAIVFTRTKRGADRVVKRLHASNIRAEAIHGDKTQGARERALSNFRANKTPILVATDIASRGIDVDGITHVVNYDLTHEPETYIHRIGRTARAGASGMAVSFCDPEERPWLKAIEKLIRRPIPVKIEKSFRPIPPSAADSDRHEGRGAGHAAKPRFAKAERPAQPHPKKAPVAPHAKPGRGSHPSQVRHPLAHTEVVREPHHAARPHRAEQKTGAVHGHAHPHAPGAVAARSGLNRRRPAGRKRPY